MINNGPIGLEQITMTPSSRYSRVQLVTICVSKVRAILVGGSQLWIIIPTTRLSEKTLDGDGDPTCFSLDEDTEIPALSRWISTLTIPARERASLDLFGGVKNVLASVTAFLEGTPRVTPEDRDILQMTWKSNEVPLVIPPKSKHTARELRTAHYGIRATSIVSRLVKVSIKGLTRSLWSR